MLVADFLEQTGMDKVELAERVGVKPKTVQSRYQVEMPDVWLERLGQSTAGDEAWEDVPPGRDQEHTPKAPPGARTVTPPPPSSPGLDVDFSGLAGYIESAYRGAADWLVPDELLAQAIRENARKAGEAWARWAESDPRVAAWLQRMMVGTPLGEVIAVHVGIGAGYVFARLTVERARLDEEARRRAEAGDDLEHEPLDDFAQQAA